MKILQINAVGQSGSTGRNCAELAAYINEQTEHECFSAFAQGELDSRSYRIGNPLEWKCHALFSRLTGEQAHFSQRGTKDLLAYMDQLRPDVVHLNNLHSNYIHLPMLLRYLARKDIPTVITLHDCWFYTARCFHYTQAGCGQWVDGCRSCPPKKRDNQTWFRDAAWKLWTEKKRLFEAIPRLGVTGVSNWIAREAERSFLSCAKEICCIYNWIDLDVFAPCEDDERIKARLGMTNQKVVLGVASAWSEAKGLSGFIELARVLGEDYCVVLVGAMAQNIALPANMRHIPATGSTQELARYYSAADVFVTLSLEETFGKVSAEALACGTPVVCYDSTANGELVGEGCGTVLAPGDLNGVVQAVRQICRTGKKQFEESCRQFVMGRFAKENQIKRYIDLYDRLQK